MKMRRILSSLLSVAMAIGAFTVPVLAEEPIVADTAWYGDGTETVYYISTPAEMFGLAKLANTGDGNDFSGKTIFLSNDIDLNNSEWTPIDTFYGVLDGNGNKIENLNISVTDTNAGLINTNYGTVRNLEIASGSIELKITKNGEQHVGSIAASVTTNGGKVENCINRVEIQASDSTSFFSGGSLFIGGIVGVAAYGSTIYGCSNYADVSCNFKNTIQPFGGGIAGGLGVFTISGAKSKSTIDFCYNGGNVTTQSTDPTYSGGIVGRIIGDSNREGAPEIRNCRSKGRISGSQNAGGIFGGMMGTSTKYANIYNCHFDGSLANGRNVGGIAGFNYANYTIENCYSVCNIESGSNKGGIVGSTYGGISNCYWRSSNGETALNAVGTVNSGGTPVDCFAIESQDEDGNWYYMNDAEKVILKDKLNEWVNKHPDSGYLKWAPDDENQEYPEFIPEYSITANTSPAEAGTITGNTAERYPRGTELTLTAEANDGYLFSGWYENGKCVCTESTYTFTVDDNRFITAQFEINSMGVYFVKHEDSERIYDIVLRGTNDMTINRLNSADFTFDFTGSDSLAYKITAAEYINVIDAGNNRYEFNFKSKDDDKLSTTPDTDKEIKIGEVEFAGFGKADFGIDASVDTNVVHPTRLYNNIVRDFVPNGKEKGLGELVINENLNDEYLGKISGIFEQKKTDLTVNVMFPNMLADDVNADYANMTVTAKGGAEYTETGAKYYERYAQLGDKGEVYTDVTMESKSTDEQETVESKGLTYTPEDGGAVAESEEATANGYVVTLQVPEGRTTLTFTGLGYRTYNVDVVIGAEESEKTVTVWNNVMDKDTVVIYGNKDSATVKTFLAGDIVEDNTINLYDLSAVVAYFGKDKLKNDDTGAPANEMNKYIQYDLNRDGQIDSKDIAMVLVSWNN